MTNDEQTLDITFEPHTKQALAWQYLTDNITTEIGYGGAAAGGKSWLAVIFIIIMCVAYPGIAIGLGRKELVTLKKTTLVTLFKAFKLYGIRKGKHFKYNQQENTITFFNDSKVYLLDMAYSPQDPLFTRFGGLELTFLIVDESNENEYQAIQILKTRIGRCLNDFYKLKPKTLETFNPSKGHVNERFWEPYKKGTLPDYRKFIQALPSDNPHTPKDYIEELEKADEITRQRLLFGNFDYDDELLKFFTWTKILEIYSNSWVAEGKGYITADVAEFGADLIVIIRWSGFRIKEIIVKNKQKVEGTAKDILLLAQTHMIPRSHICVDDDGLGKGVTTHISGCVAFHNGSKPLNDERYEDLQTQCLDYMSKEVDNNNVYIEDGVIRSDSIKERINKELYVNTRKDADKDGKIKAQPKEVIKKLLGGKSPDYRDALLMRWYWEAEKVKTNVNTSLIRTLTKTNIRKF